MHYLKRIVNTGYVIRYALFPAEGNSGDKPSGPASSVETGEIPFVVSNLPVMVGADGTLDLFFSGCCSLAAPCLLFRLKRTGFSACRAVATTAGLYLTARL